MIEQMYRIRLDSAFEGAAEQVTKSLADELREIPGVLESSRAKDSESTMDLGTVVEVVVSSGAALAIARGIADWLRGHRNIHLTIERDSKTGSIKGTADNLDPDTALRFTEIIMNNHGSTS